VAALRDVAPVAARRARALLGEAAPLDQIDVRVVDAVWRGAAPWRVELIGGDRPGQGFGIDGLRRELWDSHGRRVKLAGQPLLWRCLETLAELGGAAARREVFRRVSGGADPH